MAELDLGFLADCDKVSYATFVATPTGSFIVAVVFADNRYWFVDYVTAPGVSQTVAVWDMDDGLDLWDWPPEPMEIASIGSGDWVGRYTVRDGTPFHDRCGDAVINLREIEHGV